MRPKIGITTGAIYNLKYPWAPYTYGQTHAYSDSVTEAGGLPFLIPLTESKDTLTQTFDAFDGFLFSGGNDINAELYKQPAHDKHEPYSKSRDHLEVYLMKKALKTGKPVFAICRGFQLLNVVLGGDLHQHIATDVPQASDHLTSSKKENVYDIAHHLKLDPSSRLAAIIGKDSIGANSHHHQAIKTVAPKLTVTGWAEDGIIEAIELTDHPFCLAVQCHPETLAAKAVPEWGLVFKAFIKAASA